MKEGDALGALGIALRAANTDDAARVAEILLVSCWIFLPYAPLAHSDAEVRAWVRETLIPSGDVTVAQTDARLAGVLATAHDAVASWVTQLYVDPEFAEQGIGTRLRAHARATLPLPARLFTFQQNMRARHFHECHGFGAIEFRDGSASEERCPDVRDELAAT